MSTSYKPRFHWSQRKGGDERTLYVAWLARPKTQKKLADYGRFDIEHTDAGWHLYYTPEDSARWARIKSFETADEAKRYAEVIWIMGITDKLWGAARGIGA